MYVIVAFVAMGRLGYPKVCEGSGETRAQVALIAFQPFWARGVEAAFVPPRAARPQLVLLTCGISVVGQRGPPLVGMIVYEPGRFGVHLILRWSGSVFPRASWWAIPSTLVSVGLFELKRYLKYVDEDVSGALGDQACSRLVAGHLLHPHDCSFAPPLTCWCVSVRSQPFVREHRPQIGDIARVHERVVQTGAMCASSVEFGCHAGLRFLVAASKLVAGARNGLAPSPRFGTSVALLGPAVGGCAPAVGQC